MSALVSVDSATDVLTLVLSATAVLALIVGYARWIHPRWGRATRTWEGIKETILGREAVVDNATGRELVPAQPGMASRLSTLEDAVKTLADQHVAIQDHERRISDLEHARVERVVAQAESAAMWSTLEKAHGSTPPPLPPDDDADPID